MSDCLSLHQIYRWLVQHGKPRECGYVTIWNHKCVDWHSCRPEAWKFKAGMLLYSLDTADWLIATGGDKVGAERWSDIEGAANRLDVFRSTADQIEAERQELRPTPPQPSAHG